MRTGKPKNKIVKGDPKYDSMIVGRFINMVMQDGKKQTAQKIVYEALEQASEQVNQEPVEFFEAILRNVSPTMEVRSRRVGGATYQVPMPVRTERKEMMSMRWIINAARQKKGRPIAQLLAHELVDAYNGEGEAMKMRANVHKMAEANRAFAHFKW